MKYSLVMLSALAPTTDFAQEGRHVPSVPIAYIRLLAVLLTNKQIKPAKHSAADQAVNQRVDGPDNNRTHASARMIPG